MKAKRVIAALSALALCASPSVAPAFVEIGNSVALVASAFEDAAKEEDHNSCFPLANCSDFSSDATSSTARAFNPTPNAWDTGRSGDYGSFAESNSAYYWHVLQHMDESEAYKYGGHWELQKTKDGKDYESIDNQKVLTHTYEATFPEHDEIIPGHYNAAESNHYGSSKNDYVALTANGLTDMYKNGEGHSVAKKENGYTYWQVFNEGKGEWKAEDSDNTYGYNCSYNYWQGHHFTVTYNYFAQNYQDCWKHFIDNDGNQLGCKNPNDANDKGQYCPLANDLTGTDNWALSFPNWAWKWIEGTSSSDGKNSWGAPVPLVKRENYNKYKNESDTINPTIESNPNRNNQYFFMTYNFLPCNHMTEAEKETVRANAFSAGKSAIKNRDIFTKDYDIKSQGLPVEWYTFNKSNGTFTRYYYVDEDAAPIGPISTKTCEHKWFNDETGKMETCKEVVSETYQIKWKPRKQTYKFIEYVAPTEATTEATSSTEDTRPTEATTEPTEATTEYVPVKELTSGTCDTEFAKYNIRLYDDMTFSVTATANSSFNMINDGSGNFNAGGFAVTTREDGTMIATKLEYVDSIKNDVIPDGVTSKTAFGSIAAGTSTNVTQIRSNTVSVVLKSSGKDNITVSAGKELYTATFKLSKSDKKAFKTEKDAFVFHVPGATFELKDGKFTLVEAAAYSVNDTVNKKTVPGFAKIEDEKNKLADTIYGVSDFMINGDYHSGTETDPNGGINYSIYWDEDKTLHVKFFNLSSDLLRAKGVLTLPGFGFSNVSNGDTQMKFNLKNGTLIPSATNLKNQTKYSNGNKIVGAGEWGVAYSVAAPTESRIVIDGDDYYLLPSSEEEPMYELTVENYDGSFFTIGGKVYETQKSGDKYTFIETKNSHGLNTEWATVKCAAPISNGLSYFTNYTVATYKSKEDENTANRYITYKINNQELKFNYDVIFESGSSKATLLLTPVDKFDDNCPRSEYREGAPADSGNKYADRNMAEAAAMNAMETWVKQLNKNNTDKSIRYDVCGQNDIDKFINRYTDDVKDVNGNSIGKKQTYGYSNIFCYKVTNVVPAENTVIDFGRFLYSAGSEIDFGSSNTCGIALASSSDGASAIPGFQFSTDICKDISKQQYPSWRYGYFKATKDFSGFTNGTIRISFTPSTRLNKDGDTYKLHFGGKEATITVHTYEDQHASIEVKDDPDATVKAYTSSCVQGTSGEIVNPTENPSNTYEYKAAPETAKTDFASGGDYHSEANGLNYEMTWLENGDLDIKFFNENKDSLANTGSVQLPGIGFVNKFTCLAQKGSVYGSASSIIASKKLNSGYPLDMTGWGTAYLCSFTNNETTLAENSNLFHLIVKNYDGTPFMIGDKVYRTVTSDSDKAPYKIVLGDMDTSATGNLSGVKDTKWAEVKTLMRNVSLYCFKNNEMAHETFSGNITINGSQIPVTYDISVDNRSLTTLKILVDKDFSFNRIDKANFGKVLYTEGKTVDGSAKNNCSYTFKTENEHLAYTTPYVMAPLYTGTARNYSWKELTIQPKRTMTDGLKSGELATITIRPASYMKGDGDGFMIHANGNSFLISAHMYEDTHVTIEKVDGNEATKESSSANVAFRYPPVIDGIVLGDLNITKNGVGDGEVNIMDTIILNKFLAGTGDVDKDAADIDGNGVVDSSDALLILKYSIDLIDEDDIREIRAKNRSGASTTVTDPYLVSLMDYTQASTSTEKGSAASNNFFAKHFFVYYDKNGNATTNYDTTLKATTDAVLKEAKEERKFADSSDAILYRTYYDTVHCEKIGSEKSKAIVGMNEDGSYKYVEYLAREEYVVYLDKHVEVYNKK